MISFGTILIHKVKYLNFADSNANHKYRKNQCLSILKDLGYGILDNPVVKVKLYCAEINLLKKSNLENFYIQVFTNKSNIFRVYFYKTRDRYKITVETFFDKNEKSINEAELKRILNNLKLKFQIKGKSINYLKYLRILSYPFLERIQQI